MAKGEMIVGVDLGRDESHSAIVVMRKCPDNSLEVVSSSVFQKLPRCAKCNKPVENMIEHYDQLTAETSLIAVCHGSTEKVTLSDELLVDINGEIRFTEAFR